MVHSREEQRSKIAKGLRQAGFEVITAADSETALGNLYEMRPDLVVMANDSSEAQELCRRIRDFSPLPLIVMGPEGVFSRVVMLNLGADVYLDESIAFTELVAWIHALLRRSNPKSNRSNLKLDPGAKRVEMDGHVTDLSPTEFCLLSFLTFNEGKFVSSPQFISQLWGGKASLDTLHFYVRRLKRKLGINSTGPYRLLDCRGEGYCFYEQKADISA